MKENIFWINRKSSFLSAPYLWGVPGSRIQRNALSIDIRYSLRQKTRVFENSWRIPQMFWNSGFFSSNFQAVCQQHFADFTYSLKNIWCLVNSHSFSLTKFKLALRPFLASVSCLAKIDSICIPTHFMSQQIVWKIERYIPL